MSLREEISEMLREYETEYFRKLYGMSEDWWIDYSKHQDRLNFDVIYAGKILERVEKRIDRMIEIDNNTINKVKHDEFKFASIVSRNTLILVKEMLKQ